MYSNAMVGLVAQTSIHAGASSSEAAVDLPIQREVHTDWPVIYSSGVKGALRAHCHGSEFETDLFGPDTKNAAEHAGALLVGDARLLALPVRSLTSHVKWVSCPALLRRLQLDLKRMGHDITVPVPRFSIQSEVFANGIPQAKLFLEEFCYQVKPLDDPELMTALELICPADHHQELQENLVIVHDDQFAYLCRGAVPVVTHNAIDYKTKTVLNGQLWNEESLPPQTWMYLTLSCSNARGRGRKNGADELLAYLKEDLLSTGFIQIGGNLTTGMGWFNVHWVEV